VLRVGAQEIEKDKVTEWNGDWGKTDQERVVRGWDVSNVTQAGARKGAFEKVREGAVEVRGMKRRRE
jgi:hypothetical protein